MGFSRGIFPVFQWENQVIPGWDRHRNQEPLRAGDFTLKVAWHGILGGEGHVMKIQAASIRHFFWFLDGYRLL